MDDNGWGEDGCNDFSRNMTVQGSSAKNCTTTQENYPTFCYTSFESFDQEDFYGVRETRGCDSGNSRDADKLCAVMGNGCHTSVDSYTSDQGKVNENIQSKWICCCTGDFC